MKKTVTHLLHRTGASAVALLSNLLMAFVVYMICRIAYLLENHGYFMQNLSFSTLPDLLEGSFMFDRSAIFYTHSLYILLMLAPVWAKETPAYHRFCKWLYVVVNSLAVIINLADAVYFPYTLRRTTSSVFQEFGHENNLSGIFFTEFVRHWYLILVAVLLIYALHRLYVKPRLLRENIRTMQQKVRYTIVYVFCLAAAIPISIGAFRGGLGSGIRPITINNANQYVHRPVDAALVLNTPFALLRTIGKSVFQVPSYFVDESEAALVFSPIHRPQVSGQLRKKNVVIIIIESFGKEYIGALNRNMTDGIYKSYTPHTDRLIEESITYRYSFSNGKKSIDGMPSVLCAIPMFVEPFVLTPASMNDYTGLSGLLGKEGWSTAFFHGANRGSMGFMALANKIGFKHYYGREDYAADKRFGGDADFDGNWGIWDEPFLQYVCAKVGEMPQPFMASVFTVSSHHPFHIPDVYKKTYPEEELEIHKCIRYTDMALSKFFATARRQSWFNNTIFVITADHTNKSIHAGYKSDIGQFNVPIIIYDPSGELKTGVRHEIAQQIDIVPTLLGFVNYNKPYLAFGRDLFHTPAEDAYAVNYINGVYQYVKHGLVLQFDGQQAKGLFSIDDRELKHNLIGKRPEQKQMEKELKAIIWQYMFRMVNNRLLPSPDDK